MNFHSSLEAVLDSHKNVILNPSRAELVDHALAKREAIVSADGALVTWTKPESTGRSPKDTLVVRRPGSEANIDWDAPNNIALDPETFEMIWQDAMAALAGHEQLFVTDRAVGADSKYALPLMMVTPRGCRACRVPVAWLPSPPLRTGPRSWP